MGEVWKDIPGYGGHYMASSLGRIMAKDRIVVRRHPTLFVDREFSYKSRILKASNPDKDGYLQAHLGVDGVKFSVRVHHLVLLAFVGPRPDGQEGCHFDGNPANNSATNLRWDTHDNNSKDRKAHGNYATGELHPMAKFSNELIAKLRAEKVDYKDAARIYGMSRTHAHRLLCKTSQPARMTG